MISIPVATQAATNHDSKKNSTKFGIDGRQVMPLFMLKLLEDV